MASEDVLGIVGCVVLADELAHILEHDPELHRTFVVNNEAGRTLMRKLVKRDVDAELVPPEGLGSVKGQDGFTVLIWMNPAGPHDNQNELRSTVEAGARALKDHVAMCLCFYGLCRNSLWKIDRMGGELGIPMMILTDARGNEVDDCFGANLGGKKQYLDAIVHNRGTIFVSPGYAENWQNRQSEKPIDKVIEQVENMRFVFEHMEYSTVMRLENGLGDPDKFDHRVDAFAKIFDFKVVSKPCSLEVFEHSYGLAKERMAGARPAVLPGLAGVPSITSMPGHVSYRYR